MEKLKFGTIINASREKVWEVLWGEETYKQWAAVFAEGSSVVTDWEKGSKALFLDGSGRGMISRIADNVPYKYLSIEHLGELKDGVEDTTSDAVKQWAGVHENYTLNDSDGATELVVDMDMPTEFAGYFVDTWPKALAKVKVLAEQQ